MNPCAWISNGSNDCPVIAYPRTVDEIRKQCRENDAAYCVLKNRLVLRALNEVGITGLDDLLNGPNAFVFSMKDAVSGPKIINDYIEKNKLKA